MKSRNIFILGFTVVFVSFLIGAATLNTTSRYRFKITAVDMLDTVTAKSHFITAVETGSETVLNQYVVIDVRNPKAFVSNHLPYAINIPFDRLLDDDYKKLFSENKEKLLYCSDGILSNSAWMVLTQFGYDNLLVLDGGIQTWIQINKNPDLFAKTPSGDEVPAYDFAKIMKKDSIVTE